MGPVEVIGDSASGEKFAFARLVVDAGLVIEADVPGLARDLVGLSVLEAAAVPGERLAADALANALAQVISAPPDPARIAVAMSGGVDSAVALLRAGENAVGVTLRLWVDPAARDGERVCCSPAAVIAARETCHGLGLPHVTLDLREEFRAAVVEPFVSAYAAGTTPNPCVRCNGVFRFDALVEFARAIGAASLWTGHYARIVERDGRRLVSRGVDPMKDQSYMLATVSPELLEMVGFPLGHETKTDVRLAAAAAGLAAAGRAESQEACFLGGDDYRVFLSRHGLQDAPGPLVDVEGHELGRHDGLWRYTAGQRRGLGVSTGEPVYAVRTESATNTLVVGPRRALQVTAIEAHGGLYVPAREVEVKFRYRSGAVPASVEVDGDRLLLALHRPAEAVAPGQLAALYDGDVVVGAGVIVSASS
jgi:tRNA-uridine 2-sulfurtransferase